VGAIAFETVLEFEHRLRTVPRRPTARVEARIDEHEPPANGDVEPWELHSELALVCPEVRQRALELLPERDPDAFLATPREPVSRHTGTFFEAEHATRLSVAVIGYALWRLAETARSGLVAVAAIIALALLAQVLH